MQNSEKGERLNVNSLSVNALLLYFESKQTRELNTWNLSCLGKVSLTI